MLNTKLRIATDFNYCFEKRHVSIGCFLYHCCSSVVLKYKSQISKVVRLQCYKSVKHLVKSFLCGCLVRQRRIREANTVLNSSKLLGLGVSINGFLERGTLYL